MRNAQAVQSGKVRNGVAVSGDLCAIKSKTQTFICVYRLEIAWQKFAFHFDCIQQIEKGELRA